MCNSENYYLKGQSTDLALYFHNVGGLEDSQETKKREKREKRKKRMVRTKAAGTATS